MKVYLIKASARNLYSKYKKDTGGPPQNIFSTAAATPSWVDIEMTDETHDMKVNFKSKADIIAIFMSTPDALRAYEIADIFKAKGKTIVMGGLHTNFMQDEAAQHANAIMLGEVEEIWKKLLQDFQNNKLQKVYKRETPLDLTDLKPYPTYIIHPSVYDYTWSVVVSRGCPHKCEFCLVPKFFDKYTLRPVENIVAEIKHLKYLGVEWVELHSDNLTVNRKYALELFKALAPLNMSLYGETTIKIAEDDELLQAAADAGIKTLLFGLETISKEALAGQGKEFVKPENIKAQIAKIQSFGIQAVSDFLFGFDEHDTQIFKETLDFVRKMKLDEVYPHLVIPFPGSDTFKRLEAEGRILTKDWSKYDGTHAVYQPTKMTPKELEEGVYWFWMKQSNPIRNFFNYLFPKN